ncbi:hypothetical protein FIBSPDRAFT_862773 [Athelia psychrophila]|uniref:Uncharacterized protein n=1 Tax=Athelia psychrophila TaxID=1759441 RepID=A0A166HXU1_9AGAM|nr:hypothetical protein FIBSPDRAFT_862773 [Fibularhizoctonia sp. CBS 109695]
MNIPLPELNRTKVSTGALSSAPLSNKAALHPFTRQLDVLFPKSHELETALGGLETKHITGRTGLFALCETLSKSPSSADSRGPLYLSTSPDDDKWCIDPRGVLTLCVTKDTYERLGVAGAKLLFRGAPGGELHVIRIPLNDKAESAGMKAKWGDALMSWDRRRDEAGLGAWCYVASPTALPDDIPTVHDVKPELHTSASVHIPVPSLPARPKVDLDDWNEHMSALFEWVGMACLGAQRLDANDSVDPYVSVYEAPAPSGTGTLTHVRWAGLLHPAFVQNVIDIAVASVTKNTTGTGTGTPFVSVTAHAWPTAPVTYIPSPAREQSRDPPLRLPRDDAEDTWSLLLACGQVVGSGSGMEGDAAGEVRWALAESIGQWDSRWG